MSANFQPIHVGLFIVGIITGILACILIQNRSTKLVKEASPIIFDFMAKQAQLIDYLQETNKMYSHNVKEAIITMNTGNIKDSKQILVDTLKEASNDTAMFLAKEAIKK